MTSGTWDIFINPALTAGYVVQVTFVKTLHLMIMVAHTTIVTKKYVNKLHAPSRFRKGR
jgi:hypothetical protein